MDLRRIGLFYGLALVGPVGVHLAVRAFGVDWTGLAPVVGGLVAMLAPVVAAMVTNRASGRPVTDALGLAPAFNLLLLVAVLVPLVAEVLTVSIGFAMPGASFDPSIGGFVDRLAPLVPPGELDALRAALTSLPLHPVLLSLPQVVVAGATINAVAAMGEEAGWRGFLQAALRPLGFWPAAAIGGAMWGAWHAPILLLGSPTLGEGLLASAVFVGVCLGIAPWLAHLRERGGSTWHAAVAHGTINAAAGLAMVVTAGHDAVWTGTGGVAGMLAWAAMTLALAFVRGWR